MLTYDAHVIQAAIFCLENQLRYEETVLDCPTVAKHYLRLQLAGEANEQFAVLFLTAKLKLIAFEKLFQGTITSASVYPRIVVQKALAYNAAHVILAHNHPSDDVEPSEADKTITAKLKAVLEVVDITVVDHLIVSPRTVFSFAETALL